MEKICRLIRYDWPLHFTLLLTNWFPDNVKLLQFRGFLARPFFKSAGKNIQIGRNVTFYNPSNIYLGNNIYIAQGSWFSGNEKIMIGDNILFGPYVVVVTSNHSIKNEAYFFGVPVNREKVIFNDGCWIGSHSTILSGSVIGKCSLIASNSVLNKKTEDYSVYGGIPAKLIKYAEKK